MSEISTQSEDQAANQPMDELSMLKQRARIMGIQFSNNIGVDVLRERINQKLDADPSKEADKAPASVVNALTGDTEEPAAQERELTPKEMELKIRADLQRDEMKLVRLRIANLDPKKKDLPGEIFTVANEYLGTVKKYVPYGEATGDGYHVPYIIYRQLQERKFLNIRTNKSRINGEVNVTHSWAKEFSLEVLPPLTKDELASLAAAQAAAGVFGQD